MLQELSRRRLLAALPLLSAAPVALWRQEAQAQEAPAQQPQAQGAPAQPTEQAAPAAVHAGFPAQDPARVREMVSVSHFNLERVQELLAESPDLAKATWDWGFGDWETALGAASHTGQREIAQTLMDHGARPDIFTFAMLGQLDVVNAYVAALPGVQRMPGPHGLTLLHHARSGGDEAAAVLAFLEELGDADIRQISEPMSDEEQAGYEGTYRFGPGETDVLKVEITRDALLGIALADDFPRRLFYLGEHAFEPAGTRGSRVQFEVVNGKAVSVTVLDGAPVLTAKRF